MENHVVIRIIVAISLAFGLTYHGLRKKSLSPDGCLAAMVVGFISLAASYRFGILLLCFYYSSSKLTKLKEDIKAKLEEDYHIGGQRGMVQVFSCSLLAVIVAAVYYRLIGEESNASFGNFTNSKPIELLSMSLDRNYLAAQLACAYVAHFATANGDTWASEVGILAQSKPRLITSVFMREVPPGTNGGMSFLGTLASAAGGGFIGLVYYVLAPLYMGSGSQLWMIFYATLCGLLGSVVDSLLGATLQATYYSKQDKKILKSIHSVRKDPSSQHICGVDVLSNEAVNFLSLGIMMVLSWFIAPVVYDMFNE
ncbi:DUF92 domain-containing protein [archaeon]|nr:MAG: DUF92 domain-containing protein [archaeon]